MRFSLGFLFVFSVVFLVVFSPVFFREWPLGVDSYFVAGHVRDGVVPVGYPPLFFWLVGVLPWGLWVMVAVPLVLSFLLCLEAGLIADLLWGREKKCCGRGVFDGKTLGSRVKKGSVGEVVFGWLESHPARLTAFLCFVFPIFLYRGMVFEEDLLGLVLCFAGVFFLARYFYDGRSWDFVGVVVFFLLGLLAWRGALLFWLFAGCLSWKRKWLVLWWVALALGALGLWLSGACLWCFIPVPNFTVLEGLPGLPWGVVSGWLFGLVSVFAVRRGGFLAWLVGFFFLLGCYMSRFVFVGVVPLAVGLFFVLRDCRRDRVLFLLSCCLTSGLLVGAGFLLSVLPDGQVMDDVGGVVRECGGSCVSNEWRFGHWIDFLGGEAEFSPLGNVDDLEGGGCPFVLGNCSLNFSLVRVFPSFCLFRR